MPDGVRPAAEAISASEDALMLDSEAAAIMSSLSSGAASNECLLITPMSAADSSAAPVVGTMTVTGCPHCMGNHNFAHTCNKRRSKATVVAVSRSLRPKRGESSGPASSTTSAASAAGGASEQTPRALDFEPAATAEPPPRYESAVPERQNDAHRVPAAADAEPPHAAETAAMELVEMPSVSEAAPSFEFAKLLKVTLASPGSNAQYELEAINGSRLTVQKSKALRYPLKADEGEASWGCLCCTAQGWSHTRALCCAECGEAAPMTERETARLLAAKRVEMAEQRPSRLGGRRITMGRSTFREPRAAGVYSATNETAAGMPRVSDATRLATEQQAIDDEADAQAGHDSQWHARRLDAVLHLDSIVSMLTLGQQGIVRDGLREQLQPAAVAVAFTLYPRRAGDGGKTTAEIVSDGAAYDEGDDVGPSGATRSGSTCRRELPLVVTDSARSDEQHGPLTRAQAAAL